MNMIVTSDAVSERSDTVLHAAIDAVKTYEQDPTNAYCEFLAMELRLLNREMGYEGEGFYSPCNTIAKSFHFPALRSWDTVPKPSSRANLVLRSVGILPPGEGERMVYSIELEDQLYHSKMRAAMLCDILDRVFKNAKAVEKVHGIEVWKTMQLDQACYLAHELNDSASNGYATYCNEVGA